MSNNHGLCHNVLEAARNSCGVEFGCNFKYIQLRSNLSLGDKKDECFLCFHTALDIKCTKYKIQKYCKYVIFRTRGHFLFRISTMKIFQDGPQNSDGW